MLQTVGVMGPSRADEQQLQDAYEIGRIIAELKHALITGGMAGIMEEASRGAKEAGGLVIGICPLNDKRFMNEYVDIGILTDMGSGRNYMNILSSDAVIAIGSNGSAGTLSEIAFAIQAGTKPLMIMRPPATMRAFFEDFETEQQICFGTSPEDVRTFLGECF